MAGGTHHSEFRRTIQSVDFPSGLREVVAEYERRIGIRDEFVWRWIYSLLPEFRLSCVADERADTVRELKSLLTIFVTTLDDVAERNRDKTTFEQTRSIPYPNQRADADAPDVDTITVEFAAHVWEAFESRLEEAPRYEEFEDVFRFDLRQTINAMDYSWLVTENPAVTTSTGAYCYGAHNMVMFPYATVDLMHSPSFRPSDLDTLRKTLRELQELARIGNWATTWERELADGDFSSGVVARALEKGIIDHETLEAGEIDVDRAIADIQTCGIEGAFLTEWERRFADVRDDRPSAASVDLDALIDGMETVFDYHLESQGLK